MRHFLKFLPCLRHGQGEDEFCSYAFGADDVDIFIMRRNNLFYDCKSKPGAAFIFSAGQVCLIKTFPNFFDAVLGDADTGIFDRDEDFVIFFCCLNRYGRVRWAEFDGVISQVVKHLLNFAHVCRDDASLSGQNQLKRNPFIFADSLKGLNHHLDCVVDVKVGDVHH